MACHKETEDENVVFTWDEAEEKCTRSYDSVDTYTLPGDMVTEILKETNPVTDEDSDADACCIAGLFTLFA